MIHSMEECVVKLKAIKTMAKQGIKQAKEITETYKYEQILLEVNYLINETKEKGK
jgi:hypothetical protein